jgi:hypothetical protein
MPKLCDVYAVRPEGLRRNHDRRDESRTLDLCDSDCQTLAISKDSTLRGNPPSAELAAALTIFPEMISVVLHRSATASPRPAEAIRPYWRAGRNDLEAGRIQEIDLPRSKRQSLESRRNTTTRHPAKRLSRA